MKPKRPLKPFRAAVWNELRNRWEGSWPSKIKRVQTRVCAGSSKPKHITKRNRQKAMYEKLKMAWRAQPQNQFCAALCQNHGLFTPAEPYPHHKKGRYGDLLCDVRYFMPVCAQCHAFIHAHPKISYQASWLIKSSSKI